MAKKKRRLGMIVTKRLSGRGLGDLKDTKSISGAVFPPLLGGGLAVAGTLGMEMLGRPKDGVEQTKTQLFLQEWAPALGTAIGAAGSLALFAMVGAPQGVAALAGAVVSGGALGVKKMMDEAALVKGYPFPGRFGTGAVIGQRSGMQRMGAIVMSPLAGTRGLRGVNQARGPSSGEVVTLGAINTAAFGTPGFLQGARR